MKVFIFIFLGLSAVFEVMAQLPSSSDDRDLNIFEEIEKSESGEGVVTIDQSARIRDLVLTHVSMNKRAEGVEGFRVQLYSGSGNRARQEAIEAKEEVLSRMPDENVLVEYSAPFWRVRLGSFSHKHEALPLLEKLKRSFPNCYIVKVNDISLDSL